MIPDRVFAVKFSLGDSTAFMIDSVFVRENNDSIQIKTNQKSDEEAVSKKHAFSGQLNIGYQRGAIYFNTEDGKPQENYFLNATLGLDVFKIPFNVNLDYSSLGSIYGQKLSFNMSFDALKYRELKMKSLNEQEFKVREHLDDITKARQLSIQKSAYFETVLQDTSLLNAAYMKEKIREDSLRTVTKMDPGILKVNLDSLEENLSSGDSVINSNALLIQGAVDSLRNKSSFNKADLEQDKINGKVQQFRDSLSRCWRVENVKVDKYTSEIAETQAKADSLKKANDHLNKGYVLSNSPQDWFNSVQRLEFGLIYPDFSTFLIHGTVLNGVATEIQKGDVYIAFAHGKTLNPALYFNNTPAESSSPFHGIEGMFGNDYSTGRKITSAKFGYGRKEATHLYFGFLTGKGLQDYYLQGNASNTESNLVLELDGRIDASPKLFFEFAYGKSALNQSGLNEESEDSKSDIFSFNERTNALDAKVTYLPSKILSKINFRMKWVDPYFRSYGIEYMHRDFVRYEMSIEKKINRKVKLTFSYREEKSNVLNEFLTTSTIRAFGGSLDAKLRKNLQLRAAFNPVFQRFEEGNQQAAQLASDNYMNYAILTYWLTWKQKQVFLVSSFNDFRVNNDSNDLRYQNGSLNLSVFWNKAVSTTHAVQFASSENRMSKTSDVIFSNAVKYSIQKWVDVSAGIKNNGFSFKPYDLGYNCSVVFKKLSSKNILILFNLEKIVNGDYYYPITNKKIDQYPFFSEVKLTYNLR